MSRVLVSGASGYIATHIIKLLQENGYKVRGTVRSLQNELKVKPLRELCPRAQFPLELVEADLTSPNGWVQAMADCDYVLHTASPFPAESPKHEDDVIRPAVDGTLNVLKACKGVESIKRVVITSSGAAITANDEKREAPFTEDDWTDAKKKTIGAYFKSKVLAEKAAWDFVENLPEEEKFELTVVNPLFVLGPVLCGPITTSGDIMKKLMEKGYPMIPPANLGVVDVRDVAAAHLKAMTHPEAAGKRHILCSENMWFTEIAEILKEEFSPQGYDIVTRKAPTWLLWIISFWDNQMKMIYPTLNTVAKMDNTRMKSVLGVNPRPVKETILDMVYSMIESGKIVKKSGYKGRPA